MTRLKKSALLAASLLGLIGLIIVLNQMNRNSVQTAQTPSAVIADRFGDEQLATQIADERKKAYIELANRINALSMRVNNHAEVLIVQKRELSETEARLKSDLLKIEREVTKKVLDSLPKPVVGVPVAEFNEMKSRVDTLGERVSNLFSMSASAATPARPVISDEKTLVALGNQRFQMTQDVCLKPDAYRPADATYMGQMPADKWQELIRKCVQTESTAEQPPAPRARVAAVVPAARNLQPPPPPSGVEEDDDDQQVGDAADDESATVQRAGYVPAPGANPWEVRPEDMPTFGVSRSAAGGRRPTCPHGQTLTLFEGRQKCQVTIIDPRILRRQEYRRSATAKERACGNRLGTGAIIRLPVPGGMGNYRC